MNGVSFVFVDGVFSDALSDIRLLPKEIDFDCSKGIAFFLPKNCKLKIPLFFKFLNHSDVPCKFQNTIQLEENSEITIIEEYTDEASKKHYSTESSLTISLNENASLDYYKLQNQHDKAIHEATISVDQKKSSALAMFFVESGSLKSRTDLHIKLREPFARCQTRGLYYLTQDQQEIWNDVHVEHMAAHGKSAMFYKGVLDKKSRAFFNGKVHVHENAQHNDAHQTNHNLLLSSDAEVNTRPQLEIYTDDITCTHAATVGQLDHDAVFYLRSRGIEKNVALQLLTHAFIADIINKIDDAMIKQAIYARIQLEEYA